MVVYYYDICISYIAARRDVSGFVSPKISDMQVKQTKICMLYFPPGLNPENKGSGAK